MLSAFLKQATATKAAGAERLPLSHKVAASLSLRQVQVEKRDVKSWSDHFLAAVATMSILDKSPPSKSFRLDFYGHLPPQVSGDGVIALHPRVIPQLTAPYVLPCCRFCVCTIATRRQLQQCNKSNTLNTTTKRQKATAAACQLNQQRRKHSCWERVPLEQTLQVDVMQQLATSKSKGANNQRLRHTSAACLKRPFGAISPRFVQQMQQGKEACFSAACKVSAAKSLLREVLARVSATQAGHKHSRDTIHYVNDSHRRRIASALCISSWLSEKNVPGRAAAFPVRAAVAAPGWTRTATTAASTRSAGAGCENPSAEKVSKPLWQESELPACVAPPAGYQWLTAPSSPSTLAYLPFWARVKYPPRYAKLFLRVLPLAPLCASAVAVHLLPVWGLDEVARQLLGWSVYYASVLTAAWWGMHGSMQLSRLGYPPQRPYRSFHSVLRFGFLVCGISTLVVTVAAQQVEAAESLYMLGMSVGFLLAGDFLCYVESIMPVWLWRERLLCAGVCSAAIALLLLSEQVSAKSKQTRLNF